MKLFKMFKTRKTETTETKKFTVYILDDYGTVKHSREFNTIEDAKHYEKTISYTYPQNKIYCKF